MHRLLPLAFLAALALPAQAQHDSHAHHDASGDADVPSGLSASDVDGYLQGRGMGFARPAELNSYPGPLHVLELADALALTPEQIETTEAIRAEMLERTTALGAQLVEIERHLDAVFASGEATPEAVARMTGHAGSVRAQIRAAHLVAHIAMRDALTPEQIASYDDLRGYTN